MDDTKDVQIQDDIELEKEEEIVSEENLAEKVKKLRAELKEAQTEKQKYLDSWQRAQADFINIRKREEENKKEFMKFATEQIIVDFLSVVDSFNMAFANKVAWEKVDKDWRSGIEYIYSQFLGILKDNGVIEFGAIGEDFDPGRHMALENRKTKEKADDHKVVEVIQKGYILQGKVVRPAKVIVGEYEQ